MSRGTSGSQCPPPPAPRAHPQHAALAADASCPVLVARLDGFGAVDHVWAVHQDLGGGLHRGELRARASEGEITAREQALRPRTGSHLPAQSWIRLRQPTAWALRLAGSKEKSRYHAPATPLLGVACDQGSGRSKPRWPEAVSGASTVRVTSLRTLVPRGSQ